MASELRDILVRYLVFFSTLFLLAVLTYSKSLAQDLTLRVVNDEVKVKGGNLSLQIRIDNNSNTNFVLLGSKFFDVSPADIKKLEENRLTSGFSLLIFDDSLSHIFVDQKITTGDTTPNSIYYYHQLFVNRNQTTRKSISINSPTYLFPKGKFRACLIYIQNREYAKHDLGNMSDKVFGNYEIYDGLIKSNWFWVVSE